MAPWTPQRVRTIDFLSSSDTNSIKVHECHISTCRYKYIKRAGCVARRLCGDVDRHGQHGVRLSDVHRPRGQRHRHDRQHRPGRQGVQEQGPHG